MNLESDRENVDIIWQMVQEIGQQERHFNNLQARYRGTASTWLLATFGAIGFVSSKTISIGIDPLLMVSLIALMGSTGIWLLWVVDLLVYQRLLDACFVEGLVLERRHRWLPPVRQNMMKSQRGWFLFRVIGFYLGPVFLMMLISGICFSVWYAQAYSVEPLLGIAASLLVACIIAAIMKKVTENTTTIDSRLSDEEKPNNSPKQS